MDAASPAPAVEAVVPALSGELVVHGGRLAGTRRPLNAPLTFLGRAEGCDLRLNIDGILPVHCVLLSHSARVVLRAWPGGGEVLVNGIPVTDGPLADGDLLVIGPFEFRLCLPAPLPGDAAREKAALRVQAAAVAAQQAEITDQENRLRQRQAALGRQEAQLADHLEERGRRLARLREQVRRARSALRARREEHEKRAAEAAAELTQNRQLLTNEAGLLQARRQRLASLYRRLRVRHVRLAKAQEADAERREREIVNKRERLEREAAALAEARRHFNGEAELGRRQLQDGWDELRRAGQEWQERRVAEERELRRRADELAEAEATFADGQRLREKTCRDLTKEIEGLESRALNLRRQVRERQHEGAPETSPVPAPPDVVPAPLLVPGPQRLVDLDRMADDLRDQRRILLEHLERLVSLHARWEEEQAAACAAGAAAASDLAERECALAPRERDLAEAEADLWRREAESSQRRACLNAWQAHLRARMIAWETEREVQAAEISGREERVGRRAEALARLRRRWTERWRRGLDVLKAALDQCGQARRQYVALWAENVDRAAALGRKQRGLAERALALEQYGLEVIGRAANSAAAEKRLRRHRRRVAALSVVAERRLANEREALLVEARRLDEGSHQAFEDAAALARREADLDRRQAEWELGRVVREDEEARLRAESHALHARRELTERQAAVLRDEVERLARLLIDDEPAAPELRPWREEAAA